MKNYKNISFILFLMIGLFACNTSKKADKNKDISQNEQADSKSEPKIEESSSNVKTITAPIVVKNFYSKKGEMTDIKEYYVQQSVQDYFIKFCESDITSKELKEALDQQEGMIKTLTLKVEIREGLLDQCDEQEIQSRVGEYIVIYEIVE